MSPTYARLNNVLLAGILAGGEFAICYGVRTVVAPLDQQPQIKHRQALIRRLRWLVPAIFVPTAASSVAVIVLDGRAQGLPSAAPLS